MLKRKTKNIALTTTVTFAINVKEEFLMWMFLLKQSNKTELLDLSGVCMFFQLSVNTRSVFAHGIECDDSSLIS